MIKTRVKDNGFQGILLPGDGSKNKVMLVISGSNGGMRLTRQCAEFYHRNGIPALALAIFGTRGTQAFLDRVPLEYVENAIKWLYEQGYEKIGVDGMSKGSEIALVAASLFSELSCVIVRVPSYFISEGLKGKRPSGTSCWSYKGKELPFAPYKSRRFDILKMLKEEKEMHIITFNQDKDVKPECMINIDNIKAPILMLSSKNDTVWPSYDSAIYMENRFEEIGFRYPHKHVAYENMSHALVTDLPLIYKLAFKSERNNPKGCKKDRESMKNEILEWVEKKW